MQRYGPFAEIYRSIPTEFVNDHHAVDFECRQHKMAYELVGQKFNIVLNNGVSVFSYPTHRVVPMKFILAELCWILAGRDDLRSIVQYNRAMANYSDDDTVYTGAYGPRLEAQIEVMIEKLKQDKFSRQACAAIFKESDMVDRKVHIPCNVFLQVLIRNDALTLFVISRSSDFMTGFSIDSIHWQVLAQLFANELGVRASSVIYTLSSLHVYEKDVETLRQWSIPMNQTGETLLNTGLSLSAVMHKCRIGFCSGLTTEELAQLLGFDDESVAKCGYLQQMFLSNKNNLKR